MIRLAALLALADARRWPGRTLAVTVLLIGAAWLPALVDAPTVLGVLLAIAVAFAATVGSIALEERRAVLLVHNGARRGLMSLVAAFSMLGPGVLAWLITSGSTLAAQGPGLLGVTAVTLVIPALTAPVAAWMAVRSRGFGIQSPTRPAGWRRVMLIVVCVVIGGVVLPLGLVLAGLYLVSGSLSANRVRRGLGVILASAAMILAVVGISSSQTWFDLSITLTFLLPVLVVGVVVIGVHALAVTTGLFARTGARPRLALAPLLARRRLLAPMLGLVVLMMTVAVTESVVGASFGAREANRPKTLPTVSLPAGNTPEQAIVPVPPVDPDTLRKVASGQLSGTEASAVVIEQVGTGRPPVGNLSSSYDRIAAGDPTDQSQMLEHLSVWLAPVQNRSGNAADVGHGARWIGIVAPDDLDLLGWGAAAKPLSDGELVLTSQVAAGTYPRTAVVVGDQIVQRGAVAIDGLGGGTALPGGLVSAATAGGLSPIRTTARVVVVPTPGARARPTTTELVELGKRIQTATAKLPRATPEGLTRSQQSDLDTYAAFVDTPFVDNSVRAGSDQIEVFKSGPLNKLPYFASTADQGRRALLGLVGLPILITLAAVFLALGAGRRDDVILEIQGAPDRLRSSVAAIQAGVITTSATVLAALLGTVVPAACFALYNRGAELPGIPLVVPWFVWAMLIGVPVSTTLLAAGLALLRRRGSRSDLGASPDLVW